MLTREQWGRVASIYEAAIVLPEGDREAFVHAECGADETLRYEVESLLAQEARQGPLDTPLWEDAAEVIDSRGRLAVGSTLGPYRIEALIGRGGMGEVYRARDTGLGRDIALKVLPAAYAHDAERLARFQREAQLLATLNHPNIATVHGLETTTDVRALVLELVNGETLADRLSRGPLPFGEALDVARQMAEALQMAHDKGVVHRDLKPANIKIRSDGTVKVLDFGLARLAESEGPRAVASSMSPTITTPAMTAAGVILGTAAYMSPEQAKGKPADKRSDIWAFGCVLYEMLTGKRAFAGDDITETLAAVIRADPDWAAIPASVPPAVTLVLQRCLEKNKQTRIADISTVRFVTDTPFFTHAPPVSTSSRAPRWRRSAGLAGAAIAASIVTGVLVWSVARKSGATSPAPVTKFSITLPVDQAFGNGGMRLLAISPDGTRLAYADRRRIYVRSMSDGTTQPVSGTERSDLSQSNTATGIGLPTFSPDGRSIAFFTVTGSSGTGILPRGVIKRVNLDGGAPTTLCDTTFPLGMSWTDQGIVFGQFSTGVMRVSPNGGTPELLVRVGKDETALSPQLLPGGRTILFTVARGFSPSNVPVLLNAPRRIRDEVWSKARIVAQSLDSDRRTTLVEGGNDGRYVPSGHLVYLVQGILRAVPFDLNRLTLTGQSVAIIEGIGRTPYGSVDVGSAQLAISDTGTLVYLQGPPSVESGLARDLALVGPGTVERLNLPAMTYEHPRIAPDGKSVAFFAEGSKAAQVWIQDLPATSPPRQLTFQGNNRYPIWSADARQVTFQSDRDGAPAIFQQRADGSAAAEKLTTPEPQASHIPQSWSPDGASMLFAVEDRTGLSLWTFASRGRFTEPFGAVRSGTTLPAATFSPDGRWVAYQTGELSEATLRIYVQPFPSTGSFWTLPVTGRHPRWSADGSRLFFTVGPIIMGVDVVRQPSFRFLKPMPVLTAETGLTFGPMHTNYDIASDGRFLAPVASEGISPAATTAVRQIDVVLNWAQELKQRVTTH